MAKKNSPGSPAPKTQTAAIIEFLGSSPEQSFSPAEVAEHLGTDRARATYALADLARRGKILRSSPGQYQTLAAPPARPAKSAAKPASKSGGSPEGEASVKTPSKPAARSGRTGRRVAKKQADTTPSRPKAKSPVAAGPELSVFRVLVDGRLLLTDPAGDIWEAVKIT